MSKSVRSAAAKYSASWLGRTSGKASSSRCHVGLTASGCRPACMCRPWRTVALAEQQQFAQRAVNGCVDHEATAHRC